MALFLSSIWKSSRFLELSHGQQNLQKKKNAFREKTFLQIEYWEKSAHKSRKCAHTKSMYLALMQNTGRIEGKRYFLVDFFLNKQHFNKHLKESHYKRKANNVVLEFCFNRGIEFQPPHL